MLVSAPGGVAGCQSGLGEPASPRRNWTWYSLTKVSALAVQEALMRLTTVPSAFRNNAEVPLVSVNPVGAIEVKGSGRLVSGAGSMVISSAGSKS